MQQDGTLLEVEAPDVELVRRQVNRNLYGLARRIALRGASFVLAQSSQAMFAASGAGNPLTGSDGTPTNEQDDAEIAQSLLKAIEVDELPLTIEGHRANLTNFADIDKFSEYEYTARRWVHWAEKENNFHGES